jgi:8-hydroxy-5-deazaflavin:NADPH oxidoreductase
MKISVLGTGMVGRAHAVRLLGLGHEVVVGTQDVDKTMARTDKDAMGNEPFSVWHSEHSSLQVMTLAKASEWGEIVVNALSGYSALTALRPLSAQLSNKTLIDISNPLDFTKGMPPTLSVSNTDSLGEQIQKALPSVRVVKTLNTLNCDLQVNPKSLRNADHDVFMSGNDAAAKADVKEILKSYGWTNIIDLGDITTSRGTEMFLPLWLSLWGTLNSPSFNIKVIAD